MKSQSRKAAEPADITVKGSSAEAVESALNRINLLVEDALASNRYLQLML